MAKCTICKSKKGKRKCQIDGTFICSLCCGQKRNTPECTGCSFFKDESQDRNYRKVPFCGTEKMANSMELQDIANTIESTFCSFDLENEATFTDKTVITLLELLFNHYHFHDSELDFEDSVLKAYFDKLLQIIKQDLSTVPEEQLVQVMGAIYRSIQRRTNGGKEYLQFTHRYVGIRAGRGGRMIIRK